MCLCALTTGANPGACGIGWKVFRLTPGNKYLNWFHASRRIDLIPHKLLDANPAFSPIDLECFVTDDDTMLNLTENSGVPAMRYREGFHIYSHREDAAKLSSKDFVRPVWWFGLNAAGYDGADGKSLRPVVVARYMVFFDQEEMPEIKHERLQDMWQWIQERGAYDEVFKKETIWTVLSCNRSNNSI